MARFYPRTVTSPKRKSAPRAARRAGKRQCQTSGCRSQRAKFKTAAVSCRRVLVSEIRAGKGWGPAHKLFGSCMSRELRK